ELQDRGQRLVPAQAKARRPQPAGLGPHRGAAAVGRPGLKYHPANRRCQNFPVGFARTDRDGPPRTPDNADNKKPRGWGRTSMRGARRSRRSFFRILFGFSGSVSLAALTAPGTALAQQELPEIRVIATTPVPASGPITSVSSGGPPTAVRDGGLIDRDKVPSN